MGIAHGSHRPVWKDEEVARIKTGIRTHRVTAVASIEGIPARQFQNIRAELRGVAELKVARNTLIHRALKESDRKALQLFESVEGQTALIFTDRNPFVLFKLLEKSKRPAPAKAGDIASKDIVVEKGPTSFKPGPIVGELQNVGIPAAIERGKIVIRETRTVAKAGEKINARIADMLQRLEIHPMEVGLYLGAAYDGEILFTPQDLRIDEQAYADQFVKAVSNALHLSINIEYPTELTVTTLIQRGFREASNVAINAEIFEPEVLEILLSMGQQSALAIVRILPTEALDPELVALRDTDGTPLKPAPETA